VGQKDESLFGLLQEMLRSSLSESDSIKILMASTEKTINIVGANVLALVDRGLHFFYCFIWIAILTSPV
jgi:hypothetical protein